MTIGRTRDSAYMRFAKLNTGARFNLASSGIANCDLADLALSLNDICLHGDNAYGYPKLTERIAARFAVDPGCVVTVGGGCSFANHLAFAALLDPGDEVLLEEPTYELLLSTLQYFQANISRFARVQADGWALDAGRVATHITPRTRLIVLTNLHNPTSTRAEDAAIDQVASLAGKVGAHVLVDEVYRELLFRGPDASTSFREHANIIATSSLTKAYGLSGLRCGWCLAASPLAARMRRLNDLFGVLPPHVTECMSVAAFDRLHHFRHRADEILAANRAAYRNLLGNSPYLEQNIADHGTTVFPRLTAGNGDRLFELLLSGFETSVVPGRFFGRSDHVRIGLGADPAMTRAGLERIAEALRLLR